MRIVALFVALLLPSLPGAAASADPLKSPECSRSLAALQEARTGAGDLGSLRRQALQACLGGSGEAHRPSPTAQAPVMVPPPVIEVPAPPPPPVAQPPLPPAVTVDRPPVVTSCDLGGCWTSDGTRLNRSGPLLLGPGGTCIATGDFVRCP